VNAAIPMIASGAFGYAGQSCISVQRILVHEGVYGSFREAFVAHTREKIRAGDPRDRATVIGPMISPEAATRVRGHIASALAAGARFALNSPGEGAMMGPVILEDVPANETANTTELFAPVATLQPYADFDEALRVVNDSAFGLQAGIFTRNLALALRAHEQLEVGAVLSNQVPTFRVENMPYGGIKDSGFGREGLRYAMEDMTEIRAFIARP
jgi:acyl-CoA reductase-like NAD-dependent aldehyde dehydrogenase